MKPTNGRIVHFVNPEYGQPQAAIIAYVWGPTCVNLILQNGRTDFGDQVTPLRTSVMFDDAANPQPYTWHWPPRE